MSSKTGGSVDEVANKFLKLWSKKVRKDTGFGNLPENGCKESKLSAFLSSGQVPDVSCLNLLRCRTFISRQDKEGRWKK